MSTFQVIVSASAFILASAGAVLIILKSWTGFAICIVANLLWILAGFLALQRDYCYIAMFVFYLILNIGGLYRWRKK